ncbi:uncharacterized protein LOC100898884 [Galendromus occidentalis]|uniref:Uncharacterized protein LOC100898884 n=1 Tax=Galendromus occidentalis TaxID=34638 RepID=A0AAJ7L4S4_9ACAR|nr:uncharacterized protein LOC100898884 [Galendromus occidentalis]
MAIGNGKHLDSTGIIKKVFPKKPDPYGFLLLLTPIELRGREASFFFSDVTVPKNERELLRVGMQLKFIIIDKPMDNMKSPVDFKALQIAPLSPAMYQGAVVRAPSRDGKNMRVALDFTLEQVDIDPASYSALKLDKPLGLGDVCVVRLTWTGIVNASREMRPLDGDIVCAHRLRIPDDSIPDDDEDDGKEELPSDDGTQAETRTKKPMSRRCVSTPEKHVVGLGGATLTPKQIDGPVIIRRVGFKTPQSHASSSEDEYPPESPKPRPLNSRLTRTPVKSLPCCPEPCCQDQCYLPSLKIPSFPLQNMHAPCSCLRCLSMSHCYPMIPTGCTSCVNPEMPSWHNATGLP